MASFAVDDALSGAAAGSAFGPVGAIVGGIGGGLFGGSRRKRAREEARRLREMILRAASPEELIRIITVLQPKMKELVAAGLGPMFQSAIMTNLARNDLLGTGIGATLRNAALAIPGIKGLELAVQEGSQIQGRTVAALSGRQFDPIQRGPLFGSSTPGQLADLGAIFRGLGSKPTTAPAVSTSPIPSAAARQFDPRATFPSMQ